MVRAFEHACRRCARSFSPAVDLNQFAVLTANCPHCGLSHGYDNREGKIFTLVSEKAALLRQEPAVEEAPRHEYRPPEEPAIPEPEVYPEVHEEEQAPVTFTRPVPEYEEERPEKNRNLIPGLVAKARHIFPQLGRRRMAWATAAAALAFLTTIGILQAIPVSGEEARQALAGLNSRQADTVLDRNGHELNKLGVSQADRAELAEFHKWQLDALLFSEDRKFYEHHGVHYGAMVRAALNNLVHLRYAQGASTITQQLARIILQDRKKSIFRKLSEIRLARGLESVLPKQKILDLYINHVYLGHGNYSFASAAKFYYGKRVTELAPAEFLSIVALIPSPEKFSPLKNNRRLVQRVQNLAGALSAAAVSNMTAETWQSGMDNVLAQSGRFASETAFGEKSRQGLWPAQFARDFLVQRKILTTESQNSARVHTTIDLELQRKAESLVQKHLARARKNFRGVLKAEDVGDIRMKTRLRQAAYDAGPLLELAGVGFAREAEPQLQAALIAMQPRTGEILAMVGGESFESKNQLNRTVQMRRQTGSAIKPFVYAKATSMHLVHAATLIDDTPYVVGSGSKMWAPENINGGFEGPMPVRDALAKSRNIPAIRVGRLVGRDAMTELFSEFFFQSEAALADRFSYDETVAIGTISLSPLEVVRAFSTFANNGFLNDPILITRVEGREKVMDLRKTHADQLGLAPASKDRLLSPSENSLMVSLLKSSGRNSGSGVAGIIGKTGTSSESRDLWFVGGGKQVIVAVWVGYDDMRYAIPGATGSAIAAKLAGEFLREDFVPVEFKLQPGMVRLKVCPLSGKLASDGCSHARSEVFLSGVMPEGECLHGSGEAGTDPDYVAVMGESQFR